jgi:hypothetical protein
MKESTMNESFEGDRHHNLIDALKRQEFVAGDADLASAIAKCRQTVQFLKGDKLTTEGGEDDDIYLLLAGSAAIMVKATTLPRAKRANTWERWLPSDLLKNGRRQSLRMTRWSRSS